MTIIEDLIQMATDSAHSQSHWMRRRAAIGLKVERTALELFLERGPDNVSVEEVAAAADISRRTFFRYFRTKEEILAAMPARQMAASSHAVCQRPAKESIVEAILATTRTLQFAEEEVAIITMTQQVMIKFPEFWSRAVGDLRRAMDHSYEMMIAHRLKLQGKDESGAGVIAAGLAAIVVNVYTAWVEQHCEGSFAGKLEDGLKAFSSIGLPKAR